MTYVGKEFNTKTKTFVPVNNKQREKYLIGTAKYVSPEMLQYNVENDRSCDIWAFGVIMYQLFHGDTPFKGRTETEICQNILKGHYIINDNISKEANDLIRRLLMPNPKDRIGLGKQGIDEIMKHSFFSGMDCDKWYYETVTKM